MGRLPMLKNMPLLRFVPGLLLALAANFAGAVGLGVLKVESEPGEPLRARVPLIDLGDVPPTELGIAIASVADYEQANATRYEILSSIKLHVEADTDGAWVVLTTEQPVSESSSTVILDTTWPGGRILSQHLLRIGAAAPELVSAAPAGEPPADSEPSIRGEPSVGGETSDGGEAAGTARRTIRTVSGDSLWRIAERLAAESPMNLDQTMLALQRFNPEAFINGDIDRLRADVVLRIPDSTGIGAANEVSGRDQTAPRPMAGSTQPEPLAAPASQPAAQDDQSAGQLSLLVQEEEGADDGQGGDDELDARIAELENQLALTLEEVDRVRIEQEELRARLDDLDAQISMARQIIELRARELAQLQASLAEQAEDQAPRETGQATAADAASAAEAEAPAAAEFPRSLLENPLYLVIGAAILVFALVLLLMMRNSRRDQEREKRDENFVAIGDEETAASEPAQDGPEAAAEKVVEADDDDADNADNADNADDATAAENGNGFDFAADLDEAGEEAVAEQLNLAYSLHKMGNTAKARKLLENVIRSGNEGQIGEARQLLAVLDDLS